MRLFFPRNLSACRSRLCIRFHLATVVLFCWTVILVIRLPVSHYPLWIWLAGFYPMWWGWRILDCSSLFGVLTGPFGLLNGLCLETSHLLPRCLPHCPVRGLLFCLFCNILRIFPLAGHSCCLDQLGAPHLLQSTFWILSLHTCIQVVLRWLPLLTCHFFWFSFWGRSHPSISRWRIRISMLGVLPRLLFQICSFSQLLVFVSIHPPRTLRLPLWDERNQLCCDGHISPVLKVVETMCIICITGVNLVLVL